MEDNEEVGKRRINPPMATLFQYFERFDEVPLPDGNRYQLVGGRLLVKTEEAWVESNLTVNELLETTSGLAASDWRELLRKCVGDDEADAWREKILSYSLPGRTRIR